MVLYVVMYVATVIPLYWNPANKAITGTADLQVVLCNFQLYFSPSTYLQISVSKATMYFVRTNLEKTKEKLHLSNTTAHVAGASHNIIICHFFCEISENYC